MELKYVYVCELVGFSPTFTLLISFPSLSLVKWVKKNQNFAKRDSACEQQKGVFCRLSSLKDLKLPSALLRRDFMQQLTAGVRNQNLWNSSCTGWNRPLSPQISPPPLHTQTSAVPSFPTVSTCFSCKGPPSGLSTCYCWKWLVFLSWGGG